MSYTGLVLFFERKRIHVIMEKKLNKIDIEKQLNVVLQWVQEQIDKNDVPRFVDVIDYSKRVMQFHQLSNKKIVQALRLMPNYLMSSTQARQKLKTNRNRPMIVNGIGNIHSDVGFYSVVREFSTPTSYQNGFVIAVDTLTRFIMIHILTKDRKADSMIKAFKDIFKQFRTQYPDLKIKSIGFDREISVMSNKVQQFFKDYHIKFFPFHNTSSKSKMAENGIKLIRMTIPRLNQKPKMWWKLIQLAVNSLNNKPIRINNKFLKMKDGNYYTPKNVTVKNVEHFKKQLQNADASYYYSQFEIDPRWVKFNFKVDDFVRPKLIVISSQVLGTKRSEVTLGEEVFIIKKAIAYVSRKNTIEKAYVCFGIHSERTETFQESEIALTSNPYFNQS